MSLQQQTYAFFLIMRQQNHEMEAPFSASRTIIIQTKDIFF